jgi:3-hydroxybutyrate dehydrogenase
MASPADAQIEEVCHHLRHKGSPACGVFDGTCATPTGSRADEGRFGLGRRRHPGEQRGNPEHRPLAEMPRETWDAILAINLSAAFQTMQAAMPAWLNAAMAG